ncbi:MAG: hypothetical protein N7Q72_02930 [Spiroplasma sp. Tabriz.8]|nr:hypothetical protein [Spiroplasma sp. Tabriz.8]
MKQTNIIKWSIYININIYIYIYIIHLIFIEVLSQNDISITK